MRARLWASLGFVLASAIAVVAQPPVTITPGGTNLPSVNVVGDLTVGGVSTFTGLVTANGSLFIQAGDLLCWNTRGCAESPNDGSFILENNANTIGSRLKVDALPTIASGFGTTPSITAGSTPLAGSVNVGTGGAATSGVINFNGTAFPTAPFCVATPSLTNVPTRATTVTTTQVTLTTSTAWTASDVVGWICVSSR